MTESIPQKDNDAQTARAKRLRDEIDALTSPEKSPESAGQGGEDENKSAPPMSPREFIQKRMAELDDAENTQKKRKPAGRKSSPTKAKGRLSKSSKSSKSSKTTGSKSSKSLPARKKAKA